MMVFNDNFFPMDQSDPIGNTVRAEDQIQTTDFGGNSNAKDEATPMRFLNRSQKPIGK